MEKENSFSPSQEGIDAGRRGVLRSLPGFGAGIIAPTGILTSGLLMSGPAMADHVTIFGTLQTDSRFPQREFTVGTTKVIVNCYLLRNGTVTDSYIVLARKRTSSGAESQMAVIRGKITSGVPHFTYFTGLAVSTGSISLTGGSGRILRYGDYTHDPDQDGRLSTTVTGLDAETATGYRKIQDEHMAKMLRYVKKQRTSGTTVSDFYKNRGMIVGAHYDSNEKRVYIKTQWFGSTSNPGKYTELANNWINLKSTRNAMGLQISSAAVAFISSAFGWAKAYALTTTDDKFNYYSPAILACGMFTVGAQFTVNAVQSVFLHSAEWARYVTFVETNAASIGEI